MTCIFTPFSVRTYVRTWDNNKSSKTIKDNGWERRQGEKGEREEEGGGKEGGIKRGNR